MCIAHAFFISSGLARESAFGGAVSEILAEGNQEFIVNCLSPIDLHPERRGVRMARRPVDNG
jgi:hypothetical protein